MSSWQTWFRGRPTCPCLKEWLPAFEQVLQKRGLITGQIGIYQLTGAAAASAGTHSGGGAFDLRSTDARVVAVAREMGAPATWVRPTMSPPHIHGVLDGCPHNGPARYQIAAVKAGRDGLGAGGRRGRDPHPRPSQWRTWREGIAWARKELSVSATTTQKTFTYITRHTSPHSSSGFNPTSITIHWWGTPKAHRSGRIAGPVSWLCDARSKASAHFVVSGRDPDHGNGPVAACLVALNRRAWHSGNTTGNRTSVGIEMAPFDAQTPKATIDAHLEAAAQTVALIWAWKPATRGKPLRGHRSWKNTECPGNYTQHLARIYARAQEIYPHVNGATPGVLRVPKATVKNTSPARPGPTNPKWSDMATKAEVEQAGYAGARRALAEMMPQLEKRVSDSVLQRAFAQYPAPGVTIDKDGKRPLSTVSGTLFRTQADVRELRADMDELMHALAGATTNTKEN